MNNAKDSSQMLKPLIAIELRRQRKPMLKTALLLGGFVAIGTLLGLIDATMASMVILMATMMPICLAGMAPFQDKIEGTMEFLVNLPVSPATLVSGRFVAILVFAIASGVVGAIALVIILPDELGISGLRVALGALPAVWLGASASGWALTSLLIHYKLTQIWTRIFIPALALLYFGSWLFELAFGHPLELLRRIVAGPQGMWFAAALYVAICGLVMAGSWFVACAGVRNFRPDPDAMER